jgi:linoleoyl-CoA desaturase
MNPLNNVRFGSKDRNVFFATLRQRIAAYFSEAGISRHANTSMVIKTIVLLSGYILPFIFLLVFNPPAWLAMLCWGIMGFSFAGVGMSVMHDGNHGAYSASSRVNYWLGHTLNLCGASSFNWKLQHNFLHHTFTNVTHLDEDIDNKFILRFSPHAEIKSVHKYQWIYAIVLYGFLTLYWILVKDFVQFFRYKRIGVNKQSEAKNRITLLRIVLIKVIYFAVFFGLPLWAGMSFWLVLGGFFFMHLLAGIILTVIFQLAHTVDGTQHPLPDESGIIENDWAIHQLQTTVNFSRKNVFLTWYLGGLNYQVEHHLFPNICHVHYPRLAEIVKSTAEEFGIPYLENRSFAGALRSHFSLLKKLGTYRCTEAFMEKKAQEIEVV